MTRTLAAKAEVSTSDDLLSRRAIIAAGTATIAAAAVSAVAMPAFDADAGLLALRSRWLETLAAFDAALDVKGVTDTAMFAARKELALLPWPTIDQPDFATENVRIAKLREEALGSTITGAETADAAEAATSEANTAVVEEIAATPARTLAGLAFKVEVSEDWAHQHPELVDGIMADIVAFATAHPTMRI